MHIESDPAEVIENYGGHELTGNNKRGERGRTELTRKYDCR